MVPKTQSTKWVNPFCRLDPQSFGLRFAIVFNGIEKAVQNPVDKWVKEGIVVILHTQVEKK
jgi:hypothetical protein